MRILIIGRQLHRSFEMLSGSLPIPLGFISAAEYGVQFLTVINRQSPHARRNRAIIFTGIQIHSGYAIPSVFVRWLKPRVAPLQISRALQIRLEIGEQKSQAM